MATLQNRRITSILLQNALTALNTAVSPLYALAAVWNVSGLDDDLPDEGEVKTVLNSFAALEIPALNARSALSDVAASTETFDGLFAVPSTAFLVPFAFSGPVWSPLSQAQGFGVALKIQRLTVFVDATGTAGANLSIDLKVDDVSVLAAPLSIPIGSGDHVNLIVPSAAVTAPIIPAESVLSAHLLAAPDDAEGVTVNVWLTQS